MHTTQSINCSPVMDDIRVRLSRPFNNVGNDYASPLVIKEGKRRNARFMKLLLRNIRMHDCVKAVHKH